MGSSGYHDGSLAKAWWDAVWPGLARLGALAFCLVVWALVINYFFGKTGLIVGCIILAVYLFGILVVWTAGPTGRY